MNHCEASLRRQRKPFECQAARPAVEDGHRHRHRVTRGHQLSFGDRIDHHAGRACEGVHSSCVDGRQHRREITA